MRAEVASGADRSPRPRRRERSGRADRGDTISGATLRSVERVDWLLLALSTLYLVAGARSLPQPWLAAGAASAFGLLLVTLRIPRFASLAPRRRLWMTVAAMVLFVAVVASQTGGLQSPLTNLFLLPVVLAGVMLGGAATVFALVAVAIALVVLHAPTATPSPVAFLLAIGAEFLPLVLVGFLAQRLAASIANAEHRIRELIERDAQTGLLNMRTFDELLADEHASAEAKGRRFGLLMVDVEGLRQINTAYGYTTGNLALKTVADAIQRTIRASDLAARYGGDEFAILLVGATLDAAQAVAKRLRYAVYHSLYPAAGKMLRVTVSVGCTSYPRDARNPRDLIATADRRMRRDREQRQQPHAGRPP